MSGVAQPSVRRRSRRRSPWPPRLALAAVLLLVFAVGVALGRALGDGPPRGTTATYVRTLEPLPQQPATTGP